MNYTQVLGIFFDFSDIAVNLIEGLYSTVARFYDFLQGIIASSELTTYEQAIAGFTEIVYVLVGVFMLFRIAVSIINYIIDPDKLADKNLGGSKLLINIVVTIVLLIAFHPGEEKIVYAFLDKFEDAIIGTYNKNTKESTPGFIDKLMASNEKIDESNYSTLKISTESQSETKKNDAEGADLVCYYYNEAQIAQYAKYVATTNPDPPIIVKISYYKNKNNDSSRKKLNVFNDSFTMYYKIHSGQETVTLSSGKNYTVNFQTTLKSSDFNNDSTSINGTSISKFPTKCSEIALFKGTGAGSGWSLGSETVSFGREYIGRNTLAKALEKYIEAVADKIEDDIGSEIVKGDSEISEGVANELSMRKLNVSANAKEFANNAAITFYTCSVKDKSVCDLLDDIFENNEEISKSVGDKEIYMDFFASIFAGIGLLVFFALLSITVIIRNLKLILLQMIAPVAFICGINPGDKIRNQWFKMYFSTYVELFLYLFSIKLVLILLSMGFMQNMEGIEKLFAMIALLLFAKMVPSFISKIFGIDANTGTFRDAGNMLKTGAFMAGAGAMRGGIALGSIIPRSVSAFKNTEGGAKRKFGNALLAGTAGLGRAFGETFKGIGAGYSGHPFRGATDSIGHTKNVMANYGRGITPIDSLQDRTLGKVGLTTADIIDRAQRKEKQVADQLANGTERFDKMKSTAKETKLFKNISGYKGEGGNYLLDETKQSELAEVIAEASLMGEERGTEHIRNWLNNNCVTTSVETSSSRILNADGTPITNSRTVKTTWWQNAHLSDKLYEGKEAEAIQNASLEYESFLANSSDVQSLITNPEKLHSLELSESDIALITSNEHSYRRNKAINGAINKQIGRIQTKQKIERDDPKYVKSANARDVKNGNNSQS